MGHKAAAQRSADYEEEVSGWLVCALRSLHLCLHESLWLQFRTQGVGWTAHETRFCVRTLFVCSHPRFCASVLCLCGRTCGFLRRMNPFCFVGTSGLVSKMAPVVSTIPLGCHAFRKHVAILCCLDVGLWRRNDP